MRQHEIPGDAGLHRRRRRRGRGPASGNGKTAGRGEKGQGTRSGGKHVNPAFEGGQTPLVRRLPKRGFSNAMFRTVHEVVNLADLNRFGDGSTVDPASLRERRMVRRRRNVKILAKGELAAKGLTVHAHAFSETARRKIEAAGGTCVLISD